MRYKEGYELVNRRTNKHNIETGERLLDTLFDTAVKDLGLRLVRKPDYEEFTVVGNEYVFTKENFAGQPQRVQVDKEVPLPFVDRASLKISAGSRGFYIDKNVTTGLITAGTQASPIVLTSTAHELVTSDHVYLSEIVGLITSGELSVLNDIKHTITRIDDDNFSVAIDGSAFTAWSSGGKWECQNNVLVLGATPDGDTVKVSYIAKPELRTSLVSRIDLPDSLLMACIHTVIAEVYDLEGKIPVQHGDKVFMVDIGLEHKNKALIAENKYLQESYRRDPVPYILPSAMRELV